MGEDGTMTDLDEGYRTLRDDGSWAPPGLARITVVGPDAAAYLQGQLSQDVAALGVGASAWSLLLQPSGKLGSWLWVTRVADDGFDLDVEPVAVEAVLARLQRFKLRTDAEIRGPVESNESNEPDESDESDESDEQAERDEAIRIEAGVPRMGAEIIDEVMPAELGQWLIDRSVSFTKGCYTGQELVARVDSRGGNVPRHLRGLVVDGAVVPPAGAEIMVDDKVVGSVTSSARSAALGAPVALGFVHRTVEPPAPVTLRWDGGSAVAVVRALPLV
jgi:folate-binding protein YgfZ